MNNTYVIILFLFFFQTVISQSDIIDDKKRIYEIDYKGSQKIILKKRSNSIYKGKVVNTISRYGLINLNISKKQKIKKKVAKKLILELYIIGFDSLNVIDCYTSEMIEKSSEEMENCIHKYGDNKMCIDGTRTSFKIQVGDSIRSFFLECLHKDEIIDSTTLFRRRQALKGIKLIDEEIDLEKISDKLWKLLPKGTYSGDGPYYRIKTKYVW